MPFFIPPRSLRIPARELGPARGPLLLGRPSAGGVGNPPAGFVPGLPTGFVGIPENEYWHHPVTGELWTRPRAGVRGPTQVRVNAPGSTAGRRTQAVAFERDREVRAPAAEPVGPRAPVSIGTRNFLIGLGNVAGNLVNNVIRAVVITAAGPAAPIVAPAILPLIPRIPPFVPITTPIAQPQPTADRPERELIAGRDPASFEFGLEASRGGVTEVSDGTARGVVETVQGTRTFEFDVPFPEVGV